MSATRHVLKVNTEPPTLYLVGQEGLDGVYLVNGRTWAVDRPAPAGSIENHMPYEEWVDFVGDEGPILAAVAKAFDRPGAK